MGGTSNLNLHFPFRNKAWTTEIADRVFQEYCYPKQMLESEDTVCVYIFV